MNDFTEEELHYLLSCPSVGCYSGLYEKIQSMIDNFKNDPWNRKLIAKSHLKEAESLIIHAIGLLGLDDE
jgi:hypothetical protein